MGDVWKSEMWENKWEKCDNFDKQWEVWDKVRCVRESEKFENNLDAWEKVRKVWEKVIRVRKK